MAAERDHTAGAGAGAGAGAHAGAEAAHGTAQAPLRVLYLGNDTPAFLSRIPGVKAHVVSAATNAEALEAARTTRPDAVVAKLGVREEQRGIALSASIHAMDPTIFRIIYSYTAASKPVRRLDCYDHGKCNMVSSDEGAVATCLGRLAKQLAERHEGGYACPYCGLGGLTEDGLVEHQSMFHVYEPNRSGTCPVCRERHSLIAVHLFHAHGEESRKPDHIGGRPKVALHCFALVVVRRKSDGKYLMVQEFANQGYWLPGGGVDAMEKLQVGAVRETLEEAGVDVRLTGVVNLHYGPWRDERGGNHVRLAAVFLAEPLDESQPNKTVPDFESAGSAWASAAEVASLWESGRTRGWELGYWVNYVESGGKVSSLAVLADPVSIPRHPRNTDRVAHV